MSGIIGGAGNKTGVIGRNDLSFLKQYTMTVTATNWTTSSSVVIPYKTSNGYWWIKGNLIGTLSGYGTNNVFTLTTTGVTWVASSAFTVRHQDAQALDINGQGSFSADQLVIVWYGSLDPNSVWGFSFDVRIASKPTWAD